LEVNLDRAFKLSLDQLKLNIQKFSGHRQLQSVQHYLDANEEMVKNAVELVV